MKLPMTIAVHFFMSFAFAGGNIATVFIEGMSCLACAVKVEKQL